MTTEIQTLARMLQKRRKVLLALEDEQYKTKCKKTDRHLMEQHGKVWQSMEALNEAILTTQAKDVTDAAIQAMLCSSWMDTLKASVFEESEKERLAERVEGALWSVMTAIADEHDIDLSEYGGGYYALLDRNPFPSEVLAEGTT